MRTREDAEDLTQQTFERAVKAWSRFDPQRASAKTWLIAIARNLVIDHIRAAKPADSLDADGRAETVDSVLIEDQVSLGIAPDLASALARLSDRDREVIALRFGGDLKGAEIAEALGLTLANVQQILSRSLRRMRDELEASDGSGYHPDSRPN